MVKSGKSFHPHNPIHPLALIPGAVGNRIGRFMRTQSTTSSCPCSPQGLEAAFCNGNFALCAGATCVADPNSQGNFLCTCPVINGCSLITPSVITPGSINCSNFQANGNTVYSSYSDYAVSPSGLNYQSNNVHGGFTIAGCMGAPCQIQANGQALCSCKGIKTQSTEDLLIWTSNSSDLLNIINGSVITSATNWGWTNTQQYITTNNCCGNNTPVSSISSYNKLIFG
jgi:hypothetical protein